jgi:hypothetical protein
MDLSHRRVAGVLMCLFGVACRDASFSPTVVANLRTDRDAYVAVNISTPGRLGYSVTVVATYTNASASTIYLQRCDASDAHPSYNVTLVGTSGESSAFDPLYFSCSGVPPIVVPSGAARTDTLQLVGPVVTTSTNMPVGVLNGLVQIVYAAGTCNTGSALCAMPESSQTSNAISIQLPQ